SHYSLFPLTTATPSILTLSLHDALPISRGADQPRRRHGARAGHSPAAAAPVARMTNAETNAEILAASAAHEIGVYARQPVAFVRSEEHTSELQSHLNLVCRLLLEKKKKT